MCHLSAAHASPECDVARDIGVEACLPRDTRNDGQLIRLSSNGFRASAQAIRPYLREPPNRMIHDRVEPFAEPLCGRLDRDVCELIADTPRELVPRAWRVG